VALGLPFLDSLRPAWSATPSVTKRFIVMFQPCGIEPGHFWPPVTTKTLTPESLAGTALESLTPVRSHLLVVRGVHGSPRGFGLDGFGTNEHSLGTSTRLTASSMSGGLAEAASIDQVVARASTRWVVPRWW
jgi:hypothetical protein